MTWLHLDRVTWAVVTAAFRYRRKLRVSDRHQRGIPRGSRNVALYDAACIATVHFDRSLSIITIALAAPFYE